MQESRLEAILSATRERIAALRPHARELARRASAAPEPRRFAPALAGPAVGVIAEVKRRSPSAGVVREGLDPVQHARAYGQGGGGGGSPVGRQRPLRGTPRHLFRVGPLR